MYIILEKGFDFIVVNYNNNNNENAFIFSGEWMTWSCELVSLKKILHGKRYIMYYCYTTVFSLPGKLHCRCPDHGVYFPCEMECVRCINKHSPNVLCVVKDVRRLINLGQPKRLN